MHLGKVRLSRITYPYQRLLPLSSLLAWDPEPGDILIVDTVDRSMTVGCLQKVIRSIRLDFPVAVGVKFTLAETDHAIRLSPWVHSAGARVVVGSDSNLGTSLYESFAFPVDLTREMVEWFQLHLNLSPVEVGSVHAFCSASQASRSIADAYVAMNESDRTVRARMSRAGLPNPERWFQLIRLLQIQYRMLQNPSLSPSRAARELGYTCAQSLDNAIRQRFGLSAGRAGRLLGLEWRLHAWRERIGIQRHAA